MAQTQTPLTAPRRRGRPRKHPYPPDTEPPRKKRRYTYTPVALRNLNGHSHSTPRARPSRRQSGVDNLRRRSALKPPSLSNHQTPTSNAPFSSAAAAVSAISQSDSYKPREERSWEEFHNDLDIDIELPVFSAEELDNSRASLAGTPLNGLTGATATPLSGSALEALKAKFDATNGFNLAMPPVTPIKRGPGRPPKRQNAIFGLGSPTPQKIIPAPIQNPKERLILPKPHYRQIETFASYEKAPGVGVNFVEKAFATVGYQESEIFVQPRNLIRGGKDSLEDEVESTTSPQGLSTGGAGGALVNPRVRVEYDMDEQDERWLEEVNAERTSQGLNPIRPQHFEITMTLIEKEWHALEKRIPKPNPKPPQTHRPRSSSAAAVNGEPSGEEEQDSRCAVCDDGDCENTNAIVFCDGCDLAVHQECYGVPFIPEGQWLCRKCQLIGRNTPTCIFCPNIEGAFKQTSNMRWSHLLCAIWIPEVSLGNHTFMEPVMDVEKVPRQRWKLTCYICQQKMGACIQCSNKNCFVAFHATCARRGRLCLKMKNQHGQIQDASTLKGYCDKHVSSDWRKDHGTEMATAEAKLYYRRRMKGRKWADSQQAALANPDTSEDGKADTNGDIDMEDALQSTTSKQDRAALQKKIWRLPSGAPVVPQFVFNMVVNGLAKYNLSKRKEYVAEACKYWTLKREARRGAALLKRLQLQLDTFTSMEMTRRDFAAMGAAGAPKLQQRIDFAEKLQADLSSIAALCDTIVERENVKLGDVDTLRDIVDTIYFPMNPLIMAAFERALSFDSNYNYFKRGLRELKERLDTREYTTILPFAIELGNVFHQQVYSPEAADEPVGIPGGEVNAPKHEKKMTKKMRAKQMIKNILPDLLKAAENEADLEGKPREELRQHIQSIMDNALLPPPNFVPSVDGDAERAASVEIVQLLPDEEEVQAEEPKEEEKAIEEQINNDMDLDKLYHHQAINGTSGEVEADIETHAGAEETTHNNQDTISIRVSPGVPALSNSGTSTTYHDPLTPPTGDRDGPVAGTGGVPWYLEAFEPEGTTVHDERWPGREALRGISEELSEMDEDAINRLLDDPEKEVDDDDSKLAVPTPGLKKKARPKRKRW